MPKYLIVVACGSAAASASLVMYRLKKLLAEKGIDADLRIYRIAELPTAAHALKPDLIVVTAGSFSRGEIPPEIPVLSGVPLMTMIGADKLMNEIEQALKNKSST